MALGTDARRPVGQQLPYYRKRFTVADFLAKGLTAIFDVGWLPNGSLMVPGAPSGIYVHQAFNAGTTNQIDVGILSSPELFLNNGSLLVPAFVPLAVPGTDLDLTADNVLVVRGNLVGTAPTTGVFDLVVFYVPPDQLPV